MLWGAPSISERSLQASLALDGLPELSLIRTAGTAESFISEKSASDICLGKMRRRALLKAGGMLCPLQAAIASDRSPIKSPCSKKPWNMKHCWSGALDHQLQGPA